MLQITVLPPWARDLSNGRHWKVQYLLKLTLSNISNSLALGWWMVQITVLPPWARDLSNDRHWKLDELSRPLKCRKRKIRDTLWHVRWINCNAKNHGCPVSNTRNRDVLAIAIISTMPLFWHIHGLKPQIYTRDARSLKPTCLMASSAMGRGLIKAQLSPMPW